MNRIPHLNTQEIALSRKPSLWAELLNLRKDIFSCFVLIVLVLKSYLFIGIANNDNASSFSRLKAFYSFQAPPSLLIYTFFLVALLCFAYLLKGRLRFWYLFCFDLILSLLMVGDLMYYRGFGSFLSPYLFSQTSNLENLLASVVSMLRPIDALFFSDFIILLPAAKKIASFFQAAKRRVLVFSLLFVLSISTIYYQHYQLDIKELGEDYLFNVAWVANQTMTNLSPAGYHLYDLYNYQKDSQPHILKPAELEDIRHWLAAKAENLPDNAYKGILKGKNLVVIQVESLENFVINQKIAGQEITPNLNRLLGNSLYFPNIYEQVYNGNSSDADLMTNTSVYPVRSGSTFFRFPRNTYNSLPRLMAKKGYATLGIHPDKGSYWNWMPALNSMGFDKTFDATHFDQNDKIGLGISDYSYLSQVAAILVGEKEPFYSFMVTLTSHSPFDLPEEYWELTLTDCLNDSKLGGYFQSIRYTDRAIGHFLAKLEQSQLLDNTVFVIYGDHAGVHKYYNDEIQELEPSEEWWLDDSPRIPLIIYSKALKGEKIDVIGGQIDVMPTIAYLFDLDESYKTTAFGRNLLNTKQNYAILANRDFVGTVANDSEKDFLIRGIDIADLIIRSDYYKKEGF